MAQAIRHQRNKEPQRFDILATHKDGTVDLGSDGTLVISRCKVSSEAQPGTCTLVTEETSADVKAAAKAAKAKAEAKAAKAAAKAAAIAAGNPPPPEASDSSEDEDEEGDSNPPEP